MKEYLEIVEKINLSLTGDKDEDIKFLFSEAQKYDGHKYSTEINRAIGRLLFDLLPEDRLKEAMVLKDNLDSFLNGILIEIHTKISEEKFSEAEDLGRRMLGMNELFYKDDNVTQYVNFNSVFEYDVYCFRNQPKKHLIPGSSVLEGILYNFGFVLVQCAKYDEAMEILNKVKQMAPFNSSAEFEIGEIHKRRKDMKAFKESTDRAQQISYSSSDIGRCFRNYGYYLTELNEYKAALTSLAISTLYDHSSNAVSEIYYIEQMLGKKIDVTEYLDDAAEVLSEFSIWAAPDKEIVGMAIAGAVKYYEVERFDVSLEFYNIAYELTRDESLLPRINELKEITKSL